MTWSAQRSARNSLDVHWAACHTGAVAVGESGEAMDPGRMARKVVEHEIEAVVAGLEPSEEGDVAEVLATWRSTRTHGPRIRLVAACDRLES